MGQVPPNSSNYYRPPVSGPMAPGPGYVSIDAISAAWRLISSDFVTFVVASLIVAAISATVGAILNPIQSLLMYGAPSMPRPTPGQLLPPDYWTRSLMVLPLNILASAFHFCLNAGMMEIALRKQEGKATNVGDLFVPFRRFGQLYMAGLIYSTILTVAMVFLCLPGLIAMALLAFTPILVVRQGLNAFDAIRLSYRTLQKDVWMMTGVLVLALLATFVGVCACCVGVLFTFPIFSATVAVIYYSFFPSQPQWHSTMQPGMPSPP